MYKTFTAIEVESGCEVEGVLYDPIKETMMLEYFEDGQIKHTKVKVYPETVTQSPIATYDNIVIDDKGNIQSVFPGLPSDPKFRIISKSNYALVSNLKSSVKQKQKELLLYIKNNLKKIDEDDYKRIIEKFQL